MSVALSAVLEFLTIDGPAGPDQGCHWSTFRSRSHGPDRSGGSSIRSTVIVHLERDLLQQTPVQVDPQVVLPEQPLTFA